MTPHETTGDTKCSGVCRGKSTKISREDPPDFGAWPNLAPYVRGTGIPIVPVGVIPSLLFPSADSESEILLCSYSALMVKYCMPARSRCSLYLVTILAPTTFFFKSTNATPSS